MSTRYGMTIPLDGIPLGEQRDFIAELSDIGYTDLWTAEAGGTDGFTPLALASQWAPAARLGCAIFPAYTRGPALLAMSVASLCQAAPGRFVMGIGSSSNVIVENWNGIPFEKPYQRVRDTVRFLRRALSGEKVSEDYETFSVKSFRLGVSVDLQPKILIAALRQGMLRLAGRGRCREGDRGAHLRVPESGWRRGAQHGAPRGERVSQRPGVRGLPRVARPRRGARGHVEQVEGRRSQGRCGVDPRCGRRRPGRPRLAREVPRAHRALCRERSHDAGDRVAAAGRRPEAGGARSGASLNAFAAPPTPHRRLSTRFALLRRVLRIA
jgi:hypothetical protein